MVKIYMLCYTCIIKDVWINIYISNTNLIYMYWYNTHNLNSIIFSIIMPTWVIYGCRTLLKICNMWYVKYKHNIENIVRHGKHGFRDNIFDITNLLEDSTSIAYPWRWQNQLPWSKDHLHENLFQPLQKPNPPGRWN